MAVVSEAEYYIILREAINNRLAQEGGVAFIILIVAITSTISFYKERKRNTNHKKTPGKGKKKSKDVHEVHPWSKFCVVSILGFIITAIPLVSFAINARNDLKKSQFITVQAEYQRINDPSPKTFSYNHHATLTIEGEKISVDLPPKWSSEDFPEGKFKVVACYAKDTKLLLDIKIID